MENIFTAVSSVGIVPVIKLDDSKDAILVCEALNKGGIPIAEITFRTDAAEESIEKVSKEMPDMLVGAGTVTTKEQVDRAFSAGAKFIVSPGFNPKIAAYVLSKNIPIFPGCTTASEVELALELGIEVLKFFPAEQSGGLDKIKSLCAPYTKAKFMPTGGIDLENIATYLAFEKIVACGGSFMVKDEFIKNKEFDKITEISKRTIQTILGFELAHIGINSKDESEAISVSNTLASIFDHDVKNGNSSIFSGTMFEIMKSPFLGTHGHIAVRTNSVERAAYYMKNRGIKIKNNTAKYNDKNKIISVYIEDEIAGYAFHLLQK